MLSSAQCENIIANTVELTKVLKFHTVCSSLQPSWTLMLDVKDPTKAMRVVVV